MLRHTGQNPAIARFKRRRRLWKSEEPGWIHEVVNVELSKAQCSVMIGLCRAMAFDCGWDTSGGLYFRELMQAFRFAREKAKP
jgi:hypothetical protein